MKKPAAIKKNNGYYYINDLKISEKLLYHKFSLIARETKLAPNTISKTMNGKRRNPETINKIYSAIIELFDLKNKIANRNKSVNSN